MNKTRTINKSKPKNLACPSCGAVGCTEISVTIEIYNNYNTSYLPFSSGITSGGSVCLNCNMKYDGSRMPHSIRVQFDQLDASTSTSGYAIGPKFFVFLIVTGLLFFVVMMIRKMFLG